MAKKNQRAGNKINTGRRNSMKSETRKKKIGRMKKNSKHGDGHDHRHDGGTRTGTGRTNSLMNQKKFDNKNQNFKATKNKKFIKSFEGSDRSKISKNKSRKESLNEDKNKNKSRKKSLNEDNNSDNSDFEVITTQQIKQQVMAGNAESDADSSGVDEQLETKKLVTQQNRKKKKSGGFQSMGFSHAVHNGIMRKGYKLPTPIQRKTIPIIIEGKDVVAMARTGSGKTAAFLLPMFEKLKTHSAKSGARALILSPTRELALQTLKFTKELGKFTGLKAAVILGGDRMDDQFSALHENPDIIIATPGRLLHVLVEMNLRLKSVEYIVFDEADRLFEMGFQEQLNEIINRLPETRQSLLFSATLPKLLVEFAKAGLHDPTLIRLDVETKISEYLKISFFRCRADDKPAVLLHMLQNIISVKEQTVVFTATKHHVQYLTLILEKAGIPCTQIYSSLDQTARKINVAKFYQRRVTVMVVTDLAARGIDIPLLDNVINYHFPAKPKLFVHRVGRVARAGRTGTAYSLIASDEVAYMYDLHVFLGRPINSFSDSKRVTDDYGLYGRIQQSVIDDVNQNVIAWHKDSNEIESMKKVCSNAFKHYVRSRPLPASESVKRMKEMDRSGPSLGIHPLFKGDNIIEEERQQLLNVLKSYKSRSTIFEVNSTAKNRAFEVMKEKRTRHDISIEKSQQKFEEWKEDEISRADDIDSRPCQKENVKEEDLKDAFHVVIGSKRSNNKPFHGKKKKRKIDIKDAENYLQYRPADFQTEKAFGLGTTFDKEAAGLTLDLTGDDGRLIRKQKNQMRWDRKKKKFVRDNEQDGKKKIRTESGVLISSSYKSNAYKEWMEKSKQGESDENDSDGEVERKKKLKVSAASGSRFSILGTSNRRHSKGTDKTPGSNYRKGRFKPGKSELKQPAQILKARRLKAQKQNFEKHRQQKRMKRKATTKTSKK